MERLTKHKYSWLIECSEYTKHGCRRDCSECETHAKLERLAYYEDEAERRERSIQLSEGGRQIILMAAIDCYGKTPQVDMAIEEMAELTKALCKVKRAWSEEAIANILEEMADVQIMLDQMRLIYGQTAEIETAKLARLQRRIIDAKES